jgi:hypothetical protein
MDKLIGKPGQPGAAVTWTEDRPSDPLPSGRPGPARQVMRTGVVWSGAPGPRCVWVVPDDGGTDKADAPATLVQLDTRDRGRGRALTGGDWPDRTARGRLVSAARYVVYARAGYVVRLHLPTCPQVADRAIGTSDCRIASAKVTAWAFDPARRYLPEVVVGLTTAWCPECLLGSVGPDAGSNGASA